MSEERRITIGSLQIQRRVILAPNADDISISVEIDSTAHRDDIFDLMDTISAVADHELAKVEAKQAAAEAIAAQKALVMQLEQRERSLEVVLSLPRQKDKRIAELTASRAAYLASLRGIHDRSGKRQEFKLNEKQIVDLQKFESEIEAEKINKADAIAQVPLVEWEIAALRAKIAGEEPPPRPVDLFADAVANVGMVATA